MILFLRLKHRHTGWKRHAHGPTGSQKSLSGVFQNNEIKYTLIVYVVLLLNTADIRESLKITSYILE